MAIDRALLRASWRSWLSNDGSHVGPAWMQWIWTLLFRGGLAAVFTVLAFASGASRSTTITPAWWLRVYTQQWIVCTTIGAIIHLLFSAAVPLAGGPRAIRRWPNRKRTMFFSGIPDCSDPTLGPFDGGWTSDGLRVGAGARLGAGACPP